MSNSSPDLSESGRFAAPKPVEDRRPAGLPDEASEPRLAIAASWQLVVDLAEQTRRRHEATGELENVAVVKLAEAVLLFQARMLGGFLRPRRHVS